MRLEKLFLFKMEEIDAVEDEFFMEEAYKVSFNIEGVQFVVAYLI